MPRAEKLSHAARVLKLRELIDSRPFVTIAELQREFGVCRRTVYNDLEALQASGVPVHSEPSEGNEAHWKVERLAQKQTVTLTISQIMALSLALHSLSFLKGTEYYEELEAVLKKLFVGLAPQTRAFVERVGLKVALVPHGPKSYAKKADVLNDLLSGLLYDRMVEITYRAPQKERVVKHLVAPLSLVLYREALYLVGESINFDSRLIFSVDRISQSELLKTKFEYPADYSPETLRDGSFGLMLHGEPTEVEILFDREQAQYVRERQWHPTQQFETAADGRVRMKMTVRGTFDVLLWLLGHTGTAEVVQPPELRRQVRERAQRAVKRHS